ncbi:MAG: hypothetical protein KatS3mg010_0246 [Acidimicrobiia bacterium]|nr:MAG: hypothetical protein KatS3mg010_0246 [Acidimicrobiia bacterium]
MRVGSAVADWLRGIAREAARRERFLRAVADATASTTTSAPAPTTTTARPPSTRRASTTTELEGEALGQPISSRPTPDGGAEVLLGRGIMSATGIVAIGAMIVSARRRRRTA